MKETNLNSKQHTTRNKNLRNDTNHTSYIQNIHTLIHLTNFGIINSTPTMTKTDAPPPPPPQPPNPYRKSSNQEAFNYEFGGPIGAILTTLILPPLVLALTHFASIGRLSLSLDPFEIFASSFSHDWNTFLQCLMGMMAWFLFQVVLERFLPCEIIQGAPLPAPHSNNKLSYRINGHLAFWVTILICTSCFPTVENGRLQFTMAPLHLLYDYYGDLALAAIAWCSLLSLYLYRKSFVNVTSSQELHILAKGGDSGNPIYDFYIGRELNPRWGSFDWKEFCELRPGLIGWAVLNMAFVVVQKEKLGYVSGSMILVNVFQGLYVWDALYQERAILTTMDITTDGFGFMLVFGDMAWVPFTYSLQARYLVDHDPELGMCALMAILLTNFIGYSIFRGANSQKDAFRRDPNGQDVKHLQYLQTKRGTRLLTSGYWGMARKINYTGDWIMGLSWCLVCGSQSIVPYFYAIYFCILLIHRSERDDHMCHEKYGDDWIAYKKIVPYRFIPGII